MPKETFYSQGKNPDEPTLIVGWSTPGTSLTGVTLNGEELDRSGLNRLIRVLRRARDTTYGADE